MKKKEEKRKLILENFKELTIKKGYSNVSIDNVVEACSISKGSFYTYFSSKSEMINFILDDFNSKISSDLEKRNKNSKNFKEFLYNFILPPCNINDEKYKVILFLFSLTRSIENLDKENYKRIKEIFKIREKYLEEILIKYIDEIKIDKEKSNKYAETLIAMKDNFLHSLFIDYKSETFKFRSMKEFIKICEQEETQEQVKFLATNMEKILN